MSQKKILILILYFILRIPISLIINTHISLISIRWLSACVELLFYVIILLLLHLEREKLKDNNISSFSVVVLWISPTIIGIFGVRDLPTFLIYLAALASTIQSIRKTRKYLNFNKDVFRKDIFWLIIGSVIGIILSLLLKFPFWNDINMEVVNRSNFRLSLSLSFITWFFYYLNNSALLEEPIFRGFLWGLLQERGWKGRNILILQTFLFWISHLDTVMTFPFTFLLSLPVTGIVFGLMVMKSKSIMSTLGAHASFNSISAIFNGISTQ